MQNGKWSASSEGGKLAIPHTIRSVNDLPPDKKRALYTRLIPEEILERFHLKPTLTDEQGCDLLLLHCPPGDPFAEMELFHQIGFKDPILYGQMIDTINGLTHILLYMLNDPTSPRFNTDCLPDGTSTRFGTQCRNIKAEIAAMQFGLSPGQVRRGLRLLEPAIQAFERFVEALGQDIYFAEPLYYHNAIIFEQYGFAYAKGQALMKRIQDGFSAEGDLTALLDGTNPFRMAGAANSIRLRSWAIHDNLLGEPFMGVTMYKMVGSTANMDTCPGCAW